MIQQILIHQVKILKRILKIIQRNYIINTKKNNESKTTLIIDEPQWIVRPDKGTPNDKGSFYVAVGNKFLAHELLPINADEPLIDKYRDKGYTMLKVPPGFREDFEDNLDQALMDIAGLSTSSATKYISGVRQIGRASCRERV